MNKHVPMHSKCAKKTVIVQKKLLEEITRIFTYSSQ